MMKTIKTILLTLVFSLVAFAANVMGQDNTATATASGTVLAPLNVNTVTDLEFGDEILPGIEVIVDRADGASFSITGAADKDVELNFELPAELSGPGDPIQINFSNEDGGHNDTNEPSSATGFNPSDLYVTSLNGGELFVWLGGSIEPAINQAEGEYDADITLTVTYVAN